MNLANSIGGFFPQGRSSSVNEAIAVPNSGSVSYPNEVTGGWGDPAGDGSTSALKDGWKPRISERNNIPPKLIMRYRNGRGESIRTSADPLVPGKYMEA